MRFGISFCNFESFFEILPLFRGICSGFDAVAEVDLINAGRAHAKGNGEQFPTGCILPEAQPEAVQNFSPVVYRNLNRKRISSHNRNYAWWWNNRM
jgi:hypothetical protein